MKKIIFLDGDGTLWYPKKTVRNEKPHWIYEDETTKNNYLEHLTLAPRIIESLEWFKKQGFTLVVVSANPREEILAIKEINERLIFFGISKFIDKVRASRGDDKMDKGRVILDVLKDYNIDETDAVMVGDSYVYDYLAAEAVGVPAYWIKNPVSICKIPEDKLDKVRKIDEVSDLMRILENDRA